MKKRIRKIVISILLFITISITSLYFFYFLRNPNRNIPNDTNVFVSPANGTIISIFSSNDETVEITKENRKVLDARTKDVDEKVTIISIALTLHNVHYQKAPQNSKLIYQKHTNWKFLNAIRNAHNLQATFQNEHNQMLFETPEGIKYKIIQIAWIVTRRIVGYWQINQEFQQWENIWLIKFGSQVTIIFDDQVDIIAKLWQTVIDGETVLATKK